MKSAVSRLMRSGRFSLLAWLGLVAFQGNGIFVTGQNVEIEVDALGQRISPCEDISEQAVGGTIILDLELSSFTSLATRDIRALEDAIVNVYDAISSRNCQSGYRYLLAATIDRGSLSVQSSNNLAVPVELSSLCQGCSNDLRVLSRPRGGRAQNRALSATESIQRSRSYATNGVWITTSTYKGNRNGPRGGLNSANGGGLPELPEECYCPAPSRGVFLEALKRRISDLANDGRLQSMQMLTLRTIQPVPLTRRPPALNLNTHAEFTPNRGFSKRASDDSPSWPPAFSKSAPSQTPEPTESVTNRPSVVAVDLPTTSPNSFSTSSPTSSPVDSPLPSMPDLTVSPSIPDMTETPSSTPTALDLVPTSVPTTQSANPTSATAGTPTTVSPTVPNATDVPSVMPSTTDTTETPTTVSPTVPNATNVPSVMPSTTNITETPTVSPTVPNTTDVPSVMPSTTDTAETPTMSPTVPNTTDVPSVMPSTTDTAETPTVSPTVPNTTDVPTVMPSTAELNITDSPSLSSPDSLSPSMINDTVAPMETPPPTMSFLPTPSCFEECCRNEDCTLEGEVCFTFAGRCLSDGALRFTLSWEGDDDLDLHVETPDGTVISFRDPFDPISSGRVGEDTNQLEFDNHVESIYFEEIAPEGTYQFYQIPFNVRGDPDEWTMTVYVDGEAELTVMGTGLSDTFEFEYVK